MPDFEAHSPLFHPLQSDEDARPEALMTARTRAALAWGALQGRVTHVPDEVAHHFCCALTRLMTVDALAHSGFPGGDVWFSSWFSGLEPVPGVTTHAAAPASLVAETLLSELSLSHWGPLADAATQIRAAARFDPGDRRGMTSCLPAFAIEEAARLAGSVENEIDVVWPLAALDRLHSAAAASQHFAPPERERQLLALPSGPKALEQAMTATPLWALDLVAGAMIAHDNQASRPLPCPGAVRAEALKAHWWPRERAILVAEAAQSTAQKLTGMLDTAYRTVNEMQMPAARLRSTSRAPGLYRLLSGFGPLRPIQIEKALAVSKNGVRDLVAALVKAGLAEMTSHRSQALVRALPPPHRIAQPVVPAVEPAAITDDKFAEFDAAMADIDRLLARSNAPIQKE
jgi:hypothetical protein